MPLASRVSTAQAEDIGRRYYGVDGAAERLAAEIDDTFRLTAADGTRRLLKISATGADRAYDGAGHGHTDLGAAGASGPSFQTAVLLHLAAAAPELPVQRVIPALDGRPEVALGARDLVGAWSVPRLVRMTSWLDGPLLGTVHSSGALRWDIGATLARLNVALRGFRHPGAHRTHRWDLQNFGQLRELHAELPGIRLPPGASPPPGGLPPQELAAALGDCLDRFEAVVKPRLAALPVQVIHTDFHGENLLADGGRVTGILDFGDALAGPVAMDVGVAACYQLGAELTEADPLGTALDVVAGYHATDPLRPADLPLIGEFIAFRLATRIIVSQWTAARDPANSGYLLRRTPQAVRQFGLLRAAGPDVVHDRLRAALESAS